MLNRRNFNKKMTWTLPVISSISLPIHAQATEIVDTTTPIETTTIAATTTAQNCDFAFEWSVFLGVMATPGQNMQQTLLSFNSSNTAPAGSKIEWSIGDPNIVTGISISPSSGSIVVGSTEEQIITVTASDSIAAEKATTTLTLSTTLLDDNGEVCSEDSMDYDFDIEAVV